MTVKVSNSFLHNENGKITSSHEVVHTEPEGPTLHNTNSVLPRANAIEKLVQSFLCFIYSFFL